MCMSFLVLVIYFQFYIINAQKLWNPRSLKNADMAALRKEKTEALYILAGGLR